MPTTLLLAAPDFQTFLRPCRALKLKEFGTNSTAALKLLQRTMVVFIIDFSTLFKFSWLYCV